MEQKQQTQQTVETMVQEPITAQPAEPRRLRIELLEERVAPIAIWGE